MQCCRGRSVQSRDHLVRISGRLLQVARVDLKSGQVDQGLALLQALPGIASGLEGCLKVASGRCEIARLLVRQPEVIEDPAADPLSEAVPLFEKRQRLLEVS